MRRCVRDDARSLTERRDDRLAVFHGRGDVKQGERRGDADEDRCLRNLYARADAATQTYVSSGSRVSRARSVFTDDRSQMRSCSGCTLAPSRPRRGTAPA